MIRPFWLLFCNSLILCFDIFLVFFFNVLGCLRNISDYYVKNKNIMHVRARARTHTHTHIYMQEISLHDNIAYIRMLRAINLKFNVS
jgi:hypothetical protein